MIEKGMIFKDGIIEIEVTGFHDTDKYTYINYIQRNIEKPSLAPVFGGMIKEIFERRYIRQ